ncbi:hypothetical protein M2347_002612 [Chryseobacterium sp. H1D6B]|uniref:T9SS type A sorting domain-containing protein n=1 Tax=Chryseobacterium sp. H1D6B TaxID=2940588 RepID=UPI0015CA4BF3|nr:T9SS type A sorting domain-containing protein [Chryseobacterium sp. H1D6B]MDH6252885.1 hypothetical protein [Chryseobacterium sp. H1D6B]
MKVKLFLLLLLSAGVNTVSAQGENNNWYFGNKAALNFSTTTPAVINNSAMNTFEACGSVSDIYGNLLFYTSSEAVYNRQNQIMPNGALYPTGANNSSEQLAIVKNPANGNQYYVFTTGENSSGSISINYSIVDISLGGLGSNGGPLGDVVQGSKNIPVVNNSGSAFYSEAVSIVPNISDGSFWVLIPNGTNLYSYKLSNAGFNNGNPVISNLNFPVNLGHAKYYSIKPSPKLNNSSYSHYICVSFWQDNVNALPESAFVNKVYSFNSTTGQITSDFSLQVNGLRSYLPEFNMNASVLFLGGANIHAVDLVNSTSSAVLSMELYHQPSSNPVYATGIQRNKHGEVYISKPSSSFLGRVINPDVYGPGMGVNLNAVALGSGTTNYGLPQLVPISERQSGGGYYPCIGDLVLTSESNTSFYYQVGNTITVKDRYYLGPRHDITMQAGSSVSLLPGTDISLGAKYHAFIERCGRSSKQSLNQKDQKGMVLELDKEERMQLKNDVKIYPNPAADMLTINSDTAIETVEVFDMSGRKLAVGMSGNKVDVRNLPSGNYMIKIKNKSGILSKQFIKK